MSATCQQNVSPCLALAQGTPEEKAKKASTKNTRANHKTSQKIHRHACRTKIPDFVAAKKEKDDDSQGKKKRVSYLVLSNDYIRKISAEIETMAESDEPIRKISWGEESECVNFNQKKSVVTVKHAHRHTIKTDES